MNLPTNPKIVFLDAQTKGVDLDSGELPNLGDFSIFSKTEPDEIISRIKDADIIIVNKVEITREIIEKAPHLKLISEVATGYNNIDIEAAQDHKVAVTNIKGYSTNSVVEHTFALIFGLLKKIHYFDQHVKGKYYSNSSEFTHLNHVTTELSGKRVGIIGLGKIGSKVADIATCFGAEVVYHSSSGRHTDHPKYKHVTLYDLLNTSDIISIHAPLNEQTHNLINLQKIDSMKESAFLINVGRGGIVNEADLAEALHKNYIAGAAIDVFEVEPLPEDSPLLTVKEEKIILTPHVAWSTKESRERFLEEVTLNIKSFLAGEERNRIV